GEQLSATAKEGERDRRVGRGSTGGKLLARDRDLLVAPGNLLDRVEDIDSRESDENAFGPKGHKQKWLAVSGCWIANIFWLERPCCTARFSSTIHYPLYLLISSNHDDHCSRPSCLRPLARHGSGIPWLDAGCLRFLRRHLSVRHAGGAFPCSQERHHPDSHGHAGHAAGRRAAVRHDGRSLWPPPPVDGECAVLRDHRVPLRFCAQLHDIFHSADAVRHWHG